jgi:eukaryotic translation initiation factor 2C
MTRELLQHYAKRNPESPAPFKVLFYRDGVSDGMFGEVVMTEVKALKRAFESCNLHFMPQLTFMIVSKRHHIRFFPNSLLEADRSGNVMAGTVVDTGKNGNGEFSVGLEFFNRSIFFAVSQRYCPPV